MLTSTLSTPYRGGISGRVHNGQNLRQNSAAPAHLASTVKKFQRKTQHGVDRRSSTFTPRASAGGAPDPYANKYPGWDLIYKQLIEKYNLRSVTPDEAAIMIDEGKAILLDIRLADDYSESHPQGSVSAPAFRVIKTEDGGGIQSMLKMLVYRANGVNPTEAHPDFPAMAAAATGGSDKIVILACEAGGTPFATPNFPTGKASRSLKACWKLLYSGAFNKERVMHLSGGVLAWYNAGLPMEGENEYDTTRAGRTNNVVQDTVNK
jgi:rhodanese-related sulfurtransferase